MDFDHILDQAIELRESQIQPLLLVFEDLHWIDSETQALLDSLVESLPSAQLLLLVNYRPEYAHNWGSKTYCTQLRLDPLPPESADAFLEALLGGDASLVPLKQLLIERTEGNPFFLEESVRTLVEMQVLSGEPGAHCLAQHLPSIQVPPTVQAVLAARIDRLPQEEKSLLQTAAVIGNEVPFALLQAIAEVPENTLHRGLTHLQTTEFLYETSLFPERVYTFKHALTHEVAYGSLLQERRRVLHARIVDTLEAFGSEQVVEQVERLAHHAMRSEVWDKAVTYCRRAGAKAMEQSAYRAVVVCYEQALDALEHLPQEREMLEQAIDLRLVLRLALTALGDYEHALAHLHTAERLATALNDQRRLGRVFQGMVATYRLAGDSDRALIYSQRCYALASTLGDVELQIGSNQRLGQTYYDLGDYPRSIECMKSNVATLQGERLYKRFGANIALPAITALTTLVLGLSDVGEFAEGMVYGDEALRLAEVIDRPFEHVVTYMRVGYSYLRQGRVSQAIPLLERAVALSQAAEMQAFVLMAAAPLAVAYAASGRMAETSALLEQILVRVLDQTPHRIEIILSCSEAYLMAHRVAEASQLAQRALAHTQHYKEQGYQVQALWLLGKIAMRCDVPKIDQAKTYYQQALALAEELGMRPLQAHCHRGLGILYSQTGQSEQARAELSTAIEMYRDMEMTFWLPETEAELAAVEGKA